jgi:trehalose-phosphatase
MSLHYRLVEPERVPALIVRAREVAAELGLRIMEGRMIVELRPPVRVDKGTASVAFAEARGALRNGASAMYAGDDRTDEDAFRELRARSTRVLTVRILAREDPLDAETFAEYVLASPAELRQVLDWCAARRDRAATRAPP